MKNSVVLMMLSSALGLTLLSGCMQPYSKERIVDPSAANDGGPLELAHPNWNRTAAPDILNGDRRIDPRSRPAVVITEEAQPAAPQPAAPQPAATPAATPTPAPAPAQATSSPSSESTTESEQPVVRIPSPSPTPVKAVVSASPKPSPTPRVPAPQPTPKPTPKPAASVASKPTPTPRPAFKPVSAPQPAAPQPAAPKPADSTTGLTMASPTNKNIVENGIITPTVYFLPVIDEDANKCPGEAKVGLYLTNGRKRLDVCRRTLSFCSEQGSCMIRKAGKWLTFNVVRRVSGVDQFTEVSDGCVYGYGVQNICLDPFYSVAADLDIYRPGDVIYLPALRGRVLPNGQKHDGYLIVRDRGRGVKGKGRFDFFSGAMSWTEGKNPFVQLRLGDKSTDLEYNRVDPTLAAVIRQKRGYPKLPRTMVALNVQTNTNGTPTSSIATPGSELSADGQ